MIVVMKTGATDEQVAGVRKAIKALGFKDHPILGEERSVFLALFAPDPDLAFTSISGIASGQSP